MLELALVLDQDMERGLGAMGLTPSRAHLVWELQHRGPATQQKLATALSVTPRAVTGLVDALEQDGIVTREPHPTDRRAVVVTFTAKGRALGAKLVRDNKALARALFQPLSNRELDNFGRALSGVVERLREHTSKRSA